MFSWTTTKFCVIALIPVVLTLVWTHLDASPTLYVFDAVFGGPYHQNILHDKTVWITGASSGIGAALVCEVMQAGATHVILSSRRHDKLQEVARHCQEEISSSSTTSTSTTKVTILPYDAVDPSTSESTVEQALQSTEHGFIDVVFLNAGIFQSQPARETSRQERERLWRVNFQSPVDLTASLLSKHGTSHVVVTASVMAHGPHALSSTYAATKAALRNYFHTLAMEESVYYYHDRHHDQHHHDNGENNRDKKKNNLLRINVALPGLTDTSMWQALGDGAAVPTITGSAAMTPRRVARLILTGAMLGHPHFLFQELWIGKASALLWVWMAHYTPVIHHVVVCYLLAYIRVPVWIHERLDVMDVPLLLHRLFLLLLGSYP